MQILNSIIEIFSYRFFQNAVLASFFAAITCGIIGTYIVAKRKVFISGGITHASFGGIGLGYYFGFSPILGAGIFGVLSALGIEFFRKRTQLREDSAIAMWWAVGMALGIMMISLTPGYTPNLMSYLFGNILTVSNSDLLAMGIVAVIVVLFFALFYRMILFVSFDEEFALTNNAPVVLFNYILMSLVAVTIVINIRVSGIILVMSLLTIPQAIAHLYTNQFLHLMLYAVAFAFVGVITGLLFSYWYDIPSGASIIFSLVSYYLLLSLIKKMKQQRFLGKDKTI